MTGLRTFDEIQPVDLDRFWSKVDKRGDDECWPWLGQLLRNGKDCGLFSFKGTKLRAPRVSFYLHYGRWPVPCALHTCDWPPCVNPSHLLEGTVIDNHAHMVERGRSTFGERNPRAKLTATQVQIIRVLAGIGCTQQEIAARYGVTQTAVSTVVTRRAWAHVPDYSLGFVEVKR